MLCLVRDEDGAVRRRPDATRLPTVLYGQLYAESDLRQRATESPRRGLCWPLRSHPFPHRIGPIAVQSPYSSTTHTRTVRLSHVFTVTGNPHEPCNARTDQDRRHQSPYTRKTNQPLPRPWRARMLRLNQNRKCYAMRRRVRAKWAANAQSRDTQHQHEGRSSRLPGS